jgi:carboxymethylenebutenolidase
MSDPTRRTVLAAGVTAGIAAAVAPPAWAATTDDADLVTDTVSIPGKDGEFPGYVARPKGRGPFPLVLVVHEIFGVHAWIQDVCRRLAREGYVAVAPYLYSRQGDVTTLEGLDAVREVVAKVALDDVLADLDATLAWAGKHAHADLRRAAVTGFCWGGTVVWMFAAHRPDLKAGAAWYGKLRSPPTALVPRTPVDVAPTLRVPVLGLYGAQDGSIPLADVEAMRAALAEGPSGSEIVVYPTAGHGFLADYRPSHDAAASADAWPKMLAWLRAHGA